MKKWKNRYELNEYHFHNPVALLNEIIELEKGN